MVRERTMPEFSPRVKTIYTCPSIRSKADIFPEDTHVNDVTCFFSNSKTKTITCFGIWVTIKTTSLNMHGTLKTFSKHFHSYYLNLFCWQPCEVGGARISCKSDGWGNWGREQVSNLLGYQVNANLYTALSPGMKKV